MAEMWATSYTGASAKNVLTLEASEVLAAKPVKAMSVP